MKISYSFHFLRRVNNNLSTREPCRRLYHKVTSGERCRRILAISDIHVDLPDNLKIVESWTSGKYRNDALIVAGDATDDLTLLKLVLGKLVKAFSHVFFVPGNRELWLKPNWDADAYSSDKFTRIMKMCETIGVITTPKKLHTSSKLQPVWVVPLFSWYSTPEMNVTDSLYMKPSVGNDNIECDEIVWVDNHLCKWSNLIDALPSNYFAHLKKERLSRYYDAPVVSFSHFLPRSDLISPTQIEVNNVIRERWCLGLGNGDSGNRSKYSLKGLNFSRYAGSKTLESHIRTIGSAIHVYGHQHRNRDRHIDGVRYVSHCLGYKKEREEGLMWGLNKWKGPKQIWP